VVLLCEVVGAGFVAALDHFDVRALLLGDAQEPANGMGLPSRRLLKLLVRGASLAADQFEDLLLLGVGGPLRFLGDLGLAILLPGRFGRLLGGGFRDLGFGRREGLGRRRRLEVLNRVPDAAPCRLT
jgi:hypothetical protein